MSLVRPMRWAINVGSKLENSYGQRSMTFVSFNSVKDRTENECLAALIESNIAGQMPENLEEMKGIADGARMRYEEVLLLNLWGELWGADFTGAPELAEEPSFGRTVIDTVAADGSADREAGPRCSARVVAEPAPTRNRRAEDSLGSKA